MANRDQNLFDEMIDLVQALNADELPDDMLTSEELYRLELKKYTSCSPSQKDALKLARQAQAGDTHAREELIVNCMRYVAKVGYNIARTFEVTEYLDVIAEGNLAVVEHVETALSHLHPCAYLMKTALGYMYNYCAENKTMIKTPRSYDDKSASVNTPKNFVSLDQPLPGRDTKTLADFLPEPELCPPSTKDFAPLYQAIEELPSKTREIIVRIYGLYDTAPETKPDISRSLYKGVHPDNRPISLSAFEKVAKRHLSRKLASVYASAS